jgi:hypothetical protein
LYHRDRAIDDPVRKGSQETRGEVAARCCPGDAGGSGERKMAGDSS